ncbi:Hypothetical protein BCD_0945 (plasmid) [Borrelia crocidurae DOU]|uniref:Uncharacterized protein n=1 Tax=Borrelia crocidurae DOU TaxID=1293575 RepID=W5SPJ0_9SPIR|nr:DUF276 domain-containing protein [Borrelia crocidurae]AHH07011.1 Hypothetical protein BCD_0945 [Borrelia crocidurae DOU]
MSIAFDSDFGIQKQDIKQLVNAKREYLRNKYNIVINDDPSTIYNIIATSLAIKECELITEVNKLFDALKPDSTYWQAIKKHITIQSTTYEAVKSALLSLSGVRHANIKSSAGKVNIYLILEDEMMNNDKTEITSTALKAKIWDTLYLTCPVGTVFDGDILIDGLNDNNQKIDYKISFGKRKYAFLKIKYKVDLKNYMHLNVDSHIRNIYFRIKKNNYGDMGLSFEYQDFFAPVNEIKGVHCLNVSIAVKDDLNTKITAIESSEFKENQNVAIKDNEILDLEFTAERLIIDISS